MAPNSLCADVAIKPTNQPYNGTTVWNSRQLLELDQLCSSSYRVWRHLKSHLSK